MKNPKEILWQSSKKVCMEAASMAIASDPFFQDLLKLALSDEEPFAHRAAWTLVYMTEKNSKRIRPHLREIATELPNVKNHTQVASFLRLYDKLIFDLGDFGDLLDFCLHTIKMPQKREYVKVIALNIILKFGKTYPELAPELIEQIDLAKENLEMKHCKKKASDIQKVLKTTLSN